MPYVRKNETNLLTSENISTGRFDEKIKKLIAEVPASERIGNHTQYKGDYGRLLNQTKAFEGGGLLPQPNAGRRLPNVTQLTLLRNEPSVGGARVSVGWNDSALEVNDKIQIQVWAASDYSILTTTQNIQDISFNTLKTYSAPFVFDSSPGEFFIPASQSMVVVITAATVHSSGVISLPQFQASISVKISPLASLVETKTASFSVSTSFPTTHLIDTTSGSVTATLPPISSALSGLIQRFKKISTDGNTMTISGPQNIDGAGSLATNMAYVSYEIIADPVANQWWLIR